MSLDIHLHWNHFTFVIYIFFITYFLLYLWVFLKDILSNNFGEPEWNLLKSMLGILIVFALVPFLLFLAKPKKKNKLFFVQNILFPIFLFLTFYVNYYLDKILFKIVLIFFLLIIIWIYYYILRKIWIKPKKVILIFLLLSLIFLLTGTLFINSFIGEKKMNLPLNDCYSGYLPVGRIICADKLNHVIANQVVSCEIKPERSSIIMPREGVVTFDYNNGTRNSVDISRKSGYSFLIPDNLNYIYFEFKNNDTCLSVGYPVVYPDYDEFKSNKLSFVYLFLGMLGFCSISIPLIIKNLFDLKLLKE